MIEGKFSVNTKKPYPFFIIDNNLNNEFYNNLKNDVLNILDKSKYWNEICDTGNKSESFYVMGGGNGYINNNYSYEDSFDYLRGICRKSKNIIIFFDYFNSQEFCDFVNYKVLNLNNLSFNKYKLFSSKSKLTLFNWIFSKPVFISIKFGRYKEGSAIYPHRDSSAKLFSFIFFFGFSDGIKRNFGGTQFYTAKDDNMSNLDNKLKDHSSDNLNYLHLINDMKPNENSFCGFRVGNNSWHGVAPIKSIPNDCYRISLQINFCQLNKHTFTMKVLKILTNRKIAIAVLSKYFKKLKIN